MRTETRPTNSDAKAPIPLLKESRTLPVARTILAMSLVVLSMLSTGCISSALRESARLREVPGKIESVTFDPGGRVNIVYPVSLRWNEPRKSGQPPKVVYRVLLLDQEFMEHRDVSRGKGRALQDYLSSCVRREISIPENAPRRGNQHCEGWVLPGQMTTAGYTLEQALAVCGSRGRKPRTADVMHLMVDYEKCKAEKRDYYKEFLPLEKAFEAELRDAMASSEFIFRKQTSYRRPNGADPRVVPPQRVEWYVNDYLIKLDSGTWARFSLPERKGIPLEKRWVEKLVPFATALDIVLLPVEFPFLFVKAASISAGIPH